MIRNDSKQWFDNNELRNVSKHLKIPTSILKLVKTK